MSASWHPHRRGIHPAAAPAGLSDGIDPACLAQLFSRLVGLVEDGVVKGWLVRWTSLSIGYEEAVATILSARLGPRSVGRRMEQLYVSVTGSIAEKLAYAHYSKPRRLPYPAICGRRRDGRIAITCGPDPLLEAHLVDGLRVQTTEDGIDVLHYVDGQEKKRIVEMQMCLRRADVATWGVPRLGEPHDQQG